MTPQSTLDSVAIEAARQQMIAQQLRTWDVLDTRVLDALQSVKREDFVPQAYRHVAFADAQIPIGHGQYMLPPNVDGKILQALLIQPTDHVLDVGAGSGYLAACMGKLAERVRSVEIFPDLAERAKANVHSAAVNNVFIELADAVQLADESRYDVIAITAAIPPNNAELEQRFARALRVGGRLFMVTGAAPVMEAVKITRTTQSHWQREDLFATAIESLVNAPRPSAFVF